MAGLLLRTRRNPKRKSFPRSFGTTTTLVDCEYDLNLSNLNQNEPNAIGDPALPEACTAFLRADMATNEDRIIYDPQFTYDKSCFEQNVPVGSPLPLQAAFDSARVDGLKAVSEAVGLELNHRRGPYAEVHPVGSQDWFDAIWSALMIGQRPVGAGTLWYSQLTDNITVDSLQAVPSNDGHAWEITGVTTTDQPRMHIKWWGGEMKWFGRATINTLFATGGSDCLMDVDGKATLADLKSVGFIYILRTMLLSMLKRLFTLQNGGTQPMVSLLEEFEEDIEEEYDRLFTKPKPIPMPEETPVVITTPPNPDAGPLVWTDANDARHAVRVICDEQGLSVDMKNILSACVDIESGYMNYRKDGTPTKFENKDKVGRVWSTDWGICQINDYFHIGEGKDFPSVEYVMANPDKVVAWMADQFKAGNAHLWSSYSSGAYLKVL